MQSLLENYINGNLSDAKRQAKSRSFMSIVNFLRDYYSAETTLAIASFLKGRGTFQAACDAEHAEKVNH